MIVVIDASALIDAVLGVEAVADELKRHDLHAPVSVDAEVVHGLRRRWIAGRITGNEGAVLLSLFHAISITRHPVQPFTTRMWALRQNHSAYDAGYVALAESLNAPLLTRDGRLSRSSGHAARIEYIA